MRERNDSMLERMSKRLKLLLGILLVLLPLIVVARIVIVVRYIDPQTLFYERHTVIPDVFHWVIYTLSLAALACGFFFRLRFASANRPRLKRSVSGFSSSEGKGDILTGAPSFRGESGFDRALGRREGMPELNGATRLIYENSTASTVFASTLLGLIFVASAILIATGMIVENGFGAVNGITLVLAVFSGVFFLLAGMKRVYPYAPLFGFLSLTPPLWCVFRLIGGFLDLSQNSNEYSHVLQIACLCLLTLFFFHEGKFTLRASTYYNFGLYIASAAASLVVIATVSVPNLLLASFWMVDFNTSVFHSLVEFTAGIYIVTKLVSVARKLERLSDGDLLFCSVK